MRPGCAILLALALTWQAPTTEAAGESAGEPERVVFLLQYIGTDYRAAVANGRVIDEAEYNENSEFAAVLAEQVAVLGRQLPAEKAAALTNAASELRRLIASKAEPKAVRDLTESVIPTLIEAFHLQPFPAKPPDPARAAELFRGNCAICHGEHGRGDGPRASELDPPPASFVDPERMESVAPYVFYNAITVGVANTAMASFREALADQERWDLAFYLWTFYAPVEAQATSPPFTVSLRDLATKSAAELVPAVVHRPGAADGTLDPETVKRWIAELRARPRMLSTTEERLARVRQDLTSSIASVESGKLDAAADLVTTSYLNDFEPLEPEINRLDPAVRQSFERGLIEFRSALRRGDRDAATRTARGLEETVGRAEGLLREASRPTRTTGRLAFAAVALVGVAAAVLLASRRGIGKRRRLR